MAELIRDIKPTGIASAYIDSPFDEGKETLEKSGFEVITANQNVRLRIDYGKSAKVSTWGNYVREGVLNVPKKGIYITRGSLVMAYPKIATDAHRDGQEFYVTPEQAEKVLGDSVVVPYGESFVPVEGFEENGVTRFIFGDLAKKYGEFLKEAGITLMPLRFNSQNYIDSKEKPFANQLWLGRLGRLGRLGYDSNVSGGRGLYFSSAIRGVRLSDDAEGVAPSKPVQKVYTLSQISKAFKGSGIPRLESMVVEFLEANN